MRPIGPDGFEAMFRADADPWNYAVSPFEAFKRRTLLRACGSRMRGRVLELACANGETTPALRPTALRLVALDAAPSAVEEARRRTRDLDRIKIAVALLPQDLPQGQFDLVVVSELLYYLDRQTLRRLLERLVSAVAPGGRIVLLHHLRRFADAAQPPWLAHAAARATLGRDMTISVHRRHGRFEVIAFDRRRRSASNDR